MRRFHRWAGICLLVLAGGMLSGVAWAYVPKVNYILQKWVRNARKVNSLHVTQRTVVYDRSFPNGSILIDEEIWMQKPFRYRKTSVFPRGRVHLVVTPNRAVRIRNQKMEAVAPIDAMGPLGSLYVFQKSDRMAALLRQGGVDTDTSKWNLQDGTVSLQVGAKDGPHILFQKNSWIPIGAMLSRNEFSFPSMAASRFRTPFPDTIEVRRGKDVLQSIEVKSVRVNAKLPADTFQIEKLVADGNQ